MNTAITFQPTPHPRQPIIAIQTIPPRREPPRAPSHDFLVLSPCPDFTPEFATAGARNHCERAALATP